MPGCYPYGVRAMWSERSRHMRGGAVLGSSGKVAGLAVRFLARDMRLTGAKRLAAHRCQGGWHASRLGTGEPHVTCQDTHCRATQSILYLGASQGTSGRLSRRV